MPVYSPLVRAALAANGRYLTPEEEKAVLAYAASVPARVEAARLVEQKEEEIVDACLADIKKHYPRMTTSHPRAWEKGRRDLAMVLRYLIQGVLLDDMEVACERLFYWFRTINAAVGMTPRFSRDTYGWLRDAVRRKVPEATYALLAPHLDRAVEVLSNHAEPVTAAV